MAVKKKKQSVQNVSKAVPANKKNTKSADTALSAKPRQNSSTTVISDIKKASLPFGEQLIAAIKFLDEVRIESRKISWPERSQVIRETISVLFLVVLITILVLAFDWVMGKFVFAPLEHWGHLYGIGAGK